MKENPKTVDSIIIDCIPHTGKCPVGCEHCFYNGGFYIIAITHNGQITIVFKVLFIRKE